MFEKIFFLKNSIRPHTNKGHWGCGEAAGICCSPIGLKSPDSIRFFAATFPFSFFGLHSVASLVGDKKVERKNTHLPGMRQSGCMEIWHKRRLNNKLRMQKMCMPLLRALDASKRRVQMSNLQQSKTLERRQPIHYIQRKNSALALQRLRLPLFSRACLYERGSTKQHFYSARRSPGNCLPKMRLPKSLEGWQLSPALRRGNKSSTISLHRMPASLLQERTQHSLNLSFFFSKEEST